MGLEWQTVCHCEWASILTPEITWAAVATSGHGLPQPGNLRLWSHIVWSRGEVGRNLTPSLPTRALCTLCDIPSSIWPGAEPHWPCWGATYQIRHTRGLPRRGGGGLPPRCPRIVCLVVKHLGFWRRQGSTADPQSHCKQPEKASQKNAVLRLGRRQLLWGNFPIAAYLVWSCLIPGKFLNSRQRCLQRTGYEEPNELYINVKCILSIN